MFESVGSMPRATPSTALVGILVGPLCALAWLALVARPRIAARGGTARSREVTRAAMVGLAGVVAASALLARWVLWSHGARYVLSHPLHGAPLAGVEGPLDLRLDPLAVAACGLACVVAILGAVRALRSPADESGWKLWAWLQLALLGALLAFLADSLLTTLLGWSLAGAALAWLTGWTDPLAALAAVRRQGAAILSIGVAASVLFWGLGGGWDVDGFAQLTAPEIAAVRLGASPGPEGSLSMRRPAEAVLAMDDARRPSLEVPFFGAKVSPGRHLVRVQGGGLEGRTAAVSVPSGEDIELVSPGAALSLDGAADEVALVAEGEPVAREALESRALPGGIAVVAAALLALLAAAGAWSVVAVPRLAPPALAAMAPVLALLPAYLLTRAAFLLPSAPRAGVLVAAVGAALFLGAAWRALPLDGLARARGLALGTPGALALVALGAGGPTPAILSMGALGLGAAVFLGTRGDARDALGLETPPALAPGGVPLLERAAAFVTSMDEWVLGASADAVAGAASVAAWVVARGDEHVLATPGEIVATRLTRGAKFVRAHGPPLSYVAWTLVACGGIAALAHALLGRG